MSFVFGSFKIPAFLIFLVLSSLIIGFVIWRKREVFHLKSERVFDFIFLYNILSIIIGRLFYVIENWKTLVQLFWSIYPFYYKPGAERVWFKQMPWIVIKFWEGDVISEALLIGGILAILLFYRKLNFPKKFGETFVNALCYGQIVQILGFFLSGDYYGKETGSWIGVKFPNVDEHFRVPVQFLEIAGLVLLLFVFKYLKKMGKGKGVLGVYFFAFGWVEVIVQFLKDNGDRVGVGVNIVQIAYLILVFCGILVFVFAFQQDLTPIAKERVGMEEGSKGLKPSRLQFGYRDFHSSLVSDKKRIPALSGWIKRKWMGIKSKLFSKRPPADSI